MIKIDNEKETIVTKKQTMHIVINTFHYLMPNSKNNKHVIMESLAQALPLPIVIRLIMKYSHKE